MHHLAKCCFVVATLFACLPAARAQSPLALEFLLNDPELALGKNPRFVPLRRQGDKLPERPQAKLTYHGGPLLTRAQVYPVFWGPQTWYMQNLANFYSAVAPSEYASVWSEYSTDVQPLSGGAYAGSQVLPGSPAGHQIDDREIQRQLAALIRRGVLPRNGSGNLLFAVHLPPSVVVTAGPKTSCLDFCGYHSTFILDGDMHYYFVVPDHGQDCADVCGVGGSDVLQRVTVTASRLLAASITNPAVGVAQGAHDPMGWYDAKNGEIGDPCLGRLEIVAGWTVQKEWSNQANDCVAVRSQQR